MQNVILVIQNNYSLNYVIKKIVSFVTVFLIFNWLLGREGCTIQRYIHIQILMDIQPYLLNQTYVLDINWYTNMGCTGMKPAVLSSTEELNHSARTFRPRKPSGERNSVKAIDRRSKGVVFSQTSSLVVERFYAQNW